MITSSWSCPGFPGLLFSVMYLSSSEIGKYFPVISPNFSVRNSVVNTVLAEVWCSVCQDRFVMFEKRFFFSENEEKHRFFGE